MLGHVSPVLALHFLQVGSVRQQSWARWAGWWPSRWKLSPTALPGTSARAGLRGVRSGLKHHDSGSWAVGGVWTWPPRPRPHHCTPSLAPLPVFAGSVPLDPELSRSLEEGRDFIQEFPQSPAFRALCSIAQKVLKEAPAQLS